MEELEERLKCAWQADLFDALMRLDAEPHARLEAQIRAIDLDHLRTLIRTLVHEEGETAVPGDLEPPDVVALPKGDGDVARDRHAAMAGEELLAEGRVAAILVAGGQGTRLGFDGPKGAYPFAPITGRTLFAHHAAKIAAVRKRFGTPLPWFIMTSPQNDDATRAIFAANDWFGLPQESVQLFVQGTQPAVERRTGRILLEAPDRIALSPDGHGGLFQALRRNGLLAQMREQGITTMFTFQVDNPLARIARPALLGHHAVGGSEMTNVVVRKRHAKERTGVVARSGGRTILVEYSDLPDRYASAEEPDGSLTFWAGSIAEHCIELSLAERVTEEGAGLPFHRAVKTVPYIDAAGNRVVPDSPNAIKFESFIFDALPRANRVMSVEAAREDEFSPIKNATGDDSPHTARVDLNRMYARWLDAAGVTVPRTSDGEPAFDLEIDPGFALDAEELASRIEPGMTVTGPVVLAGQA